MKLIQRESFVDNYMHCFRICWYKLHNLCWFFVRKITMSFVSSVAWRKLNFFRAPWAIMTGFVLPRKNTIRWRHNGHDCVYNHQPHHCLLNHIFGCRSKKTSRRRVTGLCAGTSPGPVNSPHKWPVTRKMFPFDDVIMICNPICGHTYRSLLLHIHNFSATTLLVVNMMDSDSNSF